MTKLTAFEYLTYIFWASRIRRLIPQPTPLFVVDFKGLLDRNLITLDDLAKYIQNVYTADDWAYVLSIHSREQWVGDVLFNPNLSVERRQAILLSPYASDDLLASYYSNPNVPITEFRDWFDNPNNFAWRRAIVLSSDAMSVDRVYSMLKISNLSGKDIKDALDIWWMLRRNFVKLFDLLTRGYNDITLTGDTTMSGVITANVLNTNGYYLYIDGQPGVIIARKLYIPASKGVVKNTTGGAGGSAPAGAGRGGRGGGGLYLFVWEVECHRYIAAPGEGGGFGGSTTSRASGGAGGSGYMAVLSGYLPGNGGNGSPYGGGGRSPGAGGGGSESGSYPGGSGGAISTTTIPNLKDFYINLFRPVISYWIYYVLGKTDISPEGFANYYGAGGGGGGAFYSSTTGAWATGGGGGGSGGCIYAFFNYGIVDGIFSVEGGPGGKNGSNYLSTLGGGGGGGGGIIYIGYIGNLNLTNATFDVDGGLVTSDPGKPAQPGTAGSYYVEKLTF